MAILVVLQHLLAVVSVIQLTFDPFAINYMEDVLNLHGCQVGLIIMQICIRKIMSWQSNGNMTQLFLN